MIAKQTVFLTADRSRAVVELDPAAKFLLCRAGLEIADKVAGQYTDALTLLGAESVKQPAPSMEEVIGGGDREENLELEKREEEHPAKGKGKGAKKHPLGG